MADNINSIDIIQMSMVLYSLKKAQQIESTESLSLITKTLEKMEENLQNTGEDIRNLEKEIYPWLGQNVDSMV